MIKIEKLSTDCKTSKFITKGQLMSEEEFAEIKVLKGSVKYTINEKEIKIKVAEAADTTATRRSTKQNDG